MLVLTRKPGETILIDGGIVLKVISVRGNRVQLGIDAPATVRIERAELARDGDRSPREEPVRPATAGGAAAVAVA